MPKTFVKTQTLYTVDELEPSAYQKAYEKFVQDEYESGSFWSDEIIDSLKAVFDAIDGVSLRKYNIDFDYPSSSSLRVEYDNNEVKLFYGARAQAWLENNLLYKFRLPDSYRKRWTKSNVVREHGNTYGYRDGKAGELKPCPFTGVCFDDEFIFELIEKINKKWYVNDVLEHLAYVAGKLGEAEILQAVSEESFKEMCAANGWVFNERGVMVWDAGEEQE